MKRDRETRRFSSAIAGDELPIHLSYASVNLQGRVRTAQGRTLKLPQTRRPTYHDLIPNVIELPTDEDDE